MNTDKIQDLRKALFQTLRDVREDKMPIEKAKIICDVAQVIINSAKVEIDFIKAINGSEGTGFISLGKEQNQLEDA